MDNFWNLYYRIYDPARRVGRGMFNLLMFVAFIPVSVWQFYGLFHFMKELGQNMMNPTYLQSLNDAPAAPTFEWGDLLYIIVMLGLSPVFVARLRDVGWDVRWIALVYAPMLFTLLDGFLGLKIPFSGLVGIASAIMVMRLCMKASKKVDAPS